MTKRTLFTLGTAIFGGGLLQAIGFSGLFFLYCRSLEFIKPVRYEMPGLGEEIAFVLGAVVGSLGAALNWASNRRSMWWLSIGLSTGLAIWIGISEYGRSASDIVNLGLVLVIAVVGAVLGWMTSLFGTLMRQRSCPVTANPSDTNHQTESHSS